VTACCYVSAEGRGIRVRVKTPIKLLAILSTRHRASTSMYSLTFCVRVMSPERHHWKPAVQAAAVMFRTPPSPPVTNQQRAHTPLKLGFALCCHSNATGAPIANPPNSAQLGAACTTPPSYIWVRAVVWAYGRGQTDRQTHSSLYAIARPSVVCLSVCRLSSLTLVRPTQAVQIFRNISTAFGTLPIH